MSNARRDLLEVAIHVRPHFPVCADVCRAAAEYMFGLEQRGKELQALIAKLAAVAEAAILALVETEYEGTARTDTCTLLDDALRAAGYLKDA